MCRLSFLDKGVIMPAVETCIIEAAATELETQILTCVYALVAIWELVSHSFWDVDHSLSRPSLRFLSPCKDTYPHWFL